jgi:hypothetical protein
MFSSSSVRRQPNPVHVHFSFEKSDARFVLNDGARRGRCVPYALVQYTAYGKFMRMAAAPKAEGEPPRTLTTHDSLQAGLAATAVATFVTMPLETVRRQMQVRYTAIPGTVRYRHPCGGRREYDRWVAPVYQLLGMGLV